MSMRVAEICKEGFTGGELEIVAVKRKAKGKEQQALDAEERKMRKKRSATAASPPAALDASRR